MVVPEEYEEEKFDVPGSDGKDRSGTMAGAPLED